MRIILCGFTTFKPYHITHANFIHLQPRILISEALLNKVITVINKSVLWQRYLAHRGCFLLAPAGWHCGWVGWSWLGSRSCWPRRLHVVWTQLGAERRSARIMCRSAEATSFGWCCSCPSVNATGSPVPVHLQDRKTQRTGQMWWSSMTSRKKGKVSVSKLYKNGCTRTAFVTQSDKPLQYAMLTLLTLFTSGLSV